MKSTLLKGKTFYKGIGSKIQRTRLGCFYVTAMLSWGCGWFETEVEMRFSGGLVEIELRLSWVGVEISWHWIKEKIGLS